MAGREQENRMGKTDPDASLRWEKAKERHVIQNEWIDFRESVWKFPDGSQLGPFYTYSRRSYVVVVALDEQENFVTVRQFRQGIAAVTREFPAGGIEEGEDPLEAAKRELSEETGYVSDDWKFLSKLPSNATMADNYVYVYLARGCRKVTGQNLDVTEFLNAELIDRETLRAMIRGDEFLQAVHVMAYYRAMDEMQGEPGTVSTQKQTEDGNR